MAPCCVARVRTKRGSIGNSWKVVGVTSLSWLWRRAGDGATKQSPSSLLQHGLVQCPVLRLSLYWAWRKRWVRSPGVCQFAHLVTCSHVDGDGRPDSRHGFGESRVLGGVLSRGSVSSKKKKSQGHWATYTAVRLRLGQWLRALVSSDLDGLMCSGSFPCSTSAHFHRDSFWRALDGRRCLASVKVCCLSWCVAFPQLLSQIFSST